MRAASLVRRRFCYPEPPGDIVPQEVWHLRVLVLAPFSESALERLRIRCDVIHESWLETNRLWDPDELGARLAEEQIGALVVEADFLFAETIEAAPSLRLAGICRNALNHVDLECATEYGVAVVHAPGRNTRAVAEMTLGMMLALLRGIVPSHLMVSGGGWRDPALGYRSLRGREIAGSTVGIVGFGRIGKAISAMCRGLDATVLAFDPLVSEEEIVQAGATPVSLDDLARRADIVSLHVPDGEVTRGMINALFIGMMRPSAYLVNTSSGAAVDADALVRALEAGQIGGAALDVFEGQPLPMSSPLLSAPNLLLTPHVAGATQETVERHSMMMVEAIEALLDGRAIPHLVNPDYQAARAR